eukprot:scaffold85196_cov26-Tisochrysis_lutea.AAC.1
MTTRLATRVPRGWGRGSRTTRGSRRSGARRAHHAAFPGPSTMYPTPRPSPPTSRLNDNRIGDEGAARLAEGLKGHSKLTTLECAPRPPRRLPRPVHP